MSRKAKKETLVPRTIRLPQEVWTDIDKIVEKYERVLSGVTANNVVQQAIKNGLPLEMKKAQALLEVHESGIEEG